MYTWTEFNALDFDLRDGVLNFWEPGYDYNDSDFWSSYPDPEAKFIQAVQMYDWLKTNNIPEDHYDPYECLEDEDTIQNQYGDEIYWFWVKEMMDDDLREQIHDKMAPCDKQKFYDVYAKRHKEKFGEEFVCEMDHGQF